MPSESFREKQLSSPVRICQHGSVFVQVRQYYGKLYSYHTEAKTDFGVSFPDFPGCVTAGQTADEAKDFAQEAVARHITGMIENGEQMPTPFKLEDIMADADNADALAYLAVSLPDIKPRTVRINITVPEMPLKQIDAAAKKRGMSSSSLLVHLAQNAIHSNHSQPSA